MSWRCSMKKYVTPNVEYVIVSTKEDILTGSGYDPDVPNQDTHGTRFTF